MNVSRARRLALLLLFGCAGFFGLTLVGCQNGQVQKKAAKTPEVFVTPAVSRETTDFEDFTGRLEAVQKVEIKSRVTGYLNDIIFKDGAQVEENELLFEIDPRTFEAKLEQAKAALLQSQARFKKLEADLNRASGLLASRSISKEEFDKISGEFNEAEAAVQAAKAGVKSEQLYVDFTKVKAPIAGLLSRTMLDEGNLVEADKTILTSIVSQDPMYAYFDVDERTLLRVRRLIQEGKIRSARDTKVVVRMALADESEFTREGEINFVDNQVDPDTGTLRIRAKFDNPKGFMAPGMFVRIRVQIGLPHPSILVPEQAVGVDQGQKYVYVVNESNEVEYRKVTTGALLKGGLRVVEDGIAADEKVITSGLQRIQPKSKVIAKLESRTPASTAKERPSAVIEAPKK